MARLALFSLAAVAAFGFSCSATPEAEPEETTSESALETNGLTGEYFGDEALTQPRTKRVDAKVDFAWGRGAPAPGLPADGFSVRWTGRVRPAASETYTFYTQADDGVRLWVDGRLLVDRFTPSSVREDSATIRLTGGRKYDLKLEYFDRQFDATARLLWSSPSTPKSVVPSSALFTDVAIARRPANATCVAPPRPQTSIQLARAFGTSTFQQPIAMVQAPGNSSRFYVVEKRGVVLRVENGVARTFADVRSLVNAGPQEAGLLGIAFHPSFAQNGRVFLSYTAPSSTTTSGLRSVLARFVSRDGGATLDLASRAELLAFDQPFQNHNGGNIAFGPDGMLYAGFGDGGSANDPMGNGQNTRTLLGKMLRLDVDGAAPYAVPPSNPFANGGGRGEIYAIGLRNPWRWSFDRKTGELWAGDVGQDAWEEVDKIVLGGNYGWRIREGNHCHAQPCSAPNLISPVAEYGHDQGVSITGGYVYRGSAIPNLEGTYLYADFGSGRMWGLPAGGGAPRVVLDTGLNVASFAEDQQGELYVLEYTGGRVFKIAPGTSSGGGPAQLLSQTGCFDPQDPKRPRPALVPYDVNAPLWSDGADKERFLAIPDGTKIMVRPDGDLDLPIGSVAVKTFLLGGRRVETRLFVRHADGGWAGYTYEWNAQQTDAVLLPDGKQKVVGAQTWSFPSRAQCMQCHNGSAGGTLGLELAQLDRDFLYPSGTTANQIDTLAVLGMLGPVPVRGAALSPPSGTDALDLRARSYLHANCGFCHRTGGPGRGAANFRFGPSAREVGACNTPAQTSQGVLLSPGNAGQSQISARMHATDGRRMPPLGTSVVDPDGTALVDQWIASMSSCP